ncbi:MAG: hypothetical protein KAS32_31425 [Candidatus Peribacteraceae bacterium]|nr:hypothetical protein [Candidatus Peribacteraceae bacterium]
MEFIEATEKEKGLLLKAFDIDTKSFRCHYCKEPANLSNCSIVHAIDCDRPIVLCNSLLCLSEYITEQESVCVSQHKGYQGLLIELIDLLFQLDDDKNYELSDLDRYRYGKIRQKLKRG